VAGRWLIVCRVATSLILLSGGLDSTTALAAAARDRASPRALFVTYGQAADREERQAAAAVADHYSVEFETLAVTGRQFGEGEIRGRNALLIHSALLAAPPRPTTIIIGIHAGAGYEPGREAERLRELEVAHPRELRRIMEVEVGLERTLGLEREIDRGMDIGM
jgi:hypothetical protein